MSAMPIERANLPHLGQQQSPAIQGEFPLVVQDVIAHISLGNNRNVHLLRRDVSDVTSEVKAMRAILVRTSLLAMVVFTGAGSALGQTNADLKARCDQLVAYYDYYNVSRSENSDGRRNHTRIGAEIDCERGNYEAGIKAMERLLTNKAFTVPQPDVASTPDGRVRPINTARLPAGRTEQPQQASAQSNSAAYCATLSEIYRKTAPQHRDPSAAVPTAIAECQSGNTADGIPVLEQALRNEGVTLPRRTQ
jgi:hypothetical protein